MCMNHTAPRPLDVGLWHVCQRIRLFTTSRMELPPFITVAVMQRERHIAALCGQAQLCPYAIGRRLYVSQATARG